jgi:transcriptional regulator
MYVPKQYEETDPHVLHDFMRRESFALLVTAPDGVPVATHIPLYLDAENDGDGNGRFLGHVARANPQWQDFDGERQALAMFWGPHAYISPNWYVSDNLVPTWNYATVHAYGTPRVIDDVNETIAVLRRLTGAYESDATGNWTLDDMDDAVLTGMTQGIVAFEMPIARLQGKFKMNQMKKPEDAASSAAGLRGLGDAMGDIVAAEMEARLKAG